jgi:hypothetical protein
MLRKSLLLLNLTPEEKKKFQEYSREFEAHLVEAEKLVRSLAIARKKKGSIAKNVTSAREETLRHLVKYLVTTKFNMDRLAVTNKEFVISAMVMKEMKEMMRTSPKRKLKAPRIAGMLSKSTAS